MNKYTVSYLSFKYYRYNSMNKIDKLVNFPLYIIA